MYSNFRHSSQQSVMHKTLFCCSLVGGKLLLEVKYNTFKKTDGVTWEKKRLKCLQQNIVDLFPDIDIRHYSRQSKPFW